MDRAVVEAAARFHRVVTVEELHACGLGRSAIAYRVRKGWLTRIFRGVYRVGAFDDRWTREAAALLACGDAAVLSHGSAAAVCEMRPYAGGPIEVTICRGHRAGQEGIRVHRSPLKRSEVQLRSGLRVTSPARTLLDLAATLSPEDLDRTVNEAQVLNLATANELLAYLARSSRPAGAPALRAALREQPRATRSTLERTMLTLLRRVGLPLPLTNVLVEGHLVDFHWPDHGLVVETDGHGTHATRARFEGDRARDAHLTALGYRVLRFTWRQLEHDPDIVAARIAGVLARPLTNAR